MLLLVCGSMLRFSLRLALTAAASAHPLQEWERLRNLGMTAGLGEDDCLDLQCLEAWWRAASADLLLLEALLGRPLPPCQPLGEALTQAVSVDPSTGKPRRVCSRPQPGMACRCGKAGCRRGLTNGRRPPEGLLLRSTCSTSA